MEILKAILFGIVEGITEWLPISSTGHMILVDEFIKLDVSAEFLEMFLVVIQLGAILAVIFLYFDKLMPFDYRHGWKVKKDTFDTMNKAIKETKKVMEMQPKIEQLYHEVDTYVTSYQSLEKENKNIKKEVANLQRRNENLKSQNNFLTDYIHTLIEIIKEFFRKLLKQDNEKIKDITANKVKEHYNDSIFQKEDVIDVAKDTTKEKELFDYAGIEYYHAKRKDKDDFEISI